MKSSHTIQTSTTANKAILIDVNTWQQIVYVSNQTISKPRTSTWLEWNILYCRVYRPKHWWLSYLQPNWWNITVKALNLNLQRVNMQLSNAVNGLYNRPNIQQRNSLLHPWIVNNWMKPVPCQTGRCWLWWQSLKLTGSRPIFMAVIMQLYPITWTDNATDALTVDMILIRICIKSVIWIIL